VEGSDGYFYGTTSVSGTSWSVYSGAWFDYGGTMFRITTNGALTPLYSFTGGSESVSAGLLQGRDGNFYGTTPQGAGTVFKMTTNGALTSLYSFTGGNDGANPTAALVRGSDGNFYGTTYGGGVGGNGTVFRLTIVRPTPVFQTATLANDTLRLAWSTDAGENYQLQYNSDLSSTNWTNLGSPTNATGATINATDSVTNGPQRFYRVVLLP